MGKTEVAWRQIVPRHRMGGMGVGNGRLQWEGIEVAWATGVIPASSLTGTSGLGREGPKRASGLSIDALI
jgi:hypothetical protein